jgi:5-formyltetrahydrofolate cyclo-ligase
MNSNVSPFLTKDALRRSMREALRGALPAQRVKWGEEIRRHLMEEAWWMPPRGGVVALFGGMATEPDLLPLLPWLAERGVRAAFFSIEGSVMTPRVVARAEELRPGLMGVMEPDAAVCETVPVEALEAVLLPGVAFGALNGARLGRGKGHYDRVLERLPESSICIGVCFHLQLHDSVPLEPHDRHVQAIVTERGWVRIPE